MVNKNILPVEEWAQIQNFQNDGIKSYFGWVSLLISQPSVLYWLREEHVTQIFVGKTESMEYYGIWLKKTRIYSISVILSKPVRNTTTHCLGFYWEN